MSNEVIGKGHNCTRRKTTWGFYEPKTVRKKNVCYYIDFIPLVKNYSYEYCTLVGAMFVYFWQPSQKGHHDLPREVCLILGPGRCSSDFYESSMIAPFLLGLWTIERQVDIYIFSDLKVF